MGRSWILPPLLWSKQCWLHRLGNNPSPDQQLGLTDSCLLPTEFSCYYFFSSLLPQTVATTCHPGYFPEGPSILPTQGLCPGRSLCLEDSSFSLHLASSTHWKLRLDRPSLATLSKIVSFVEIAVCSPSSFFSVAFICIICRYVHLLVCYLTPPLECKPVRPGTQCCLLLCV